MKELYVFYAEAGKSLVEIPENEPSIFLAGPTPRSSRIPSWRPVALHMLSQLEFEGSVFVPETPLGGISMEYNDQIEWEETYLTQARCIMFWIPRDLEFLPGFTTNIEFGAWKNSKKIVVGTPTDAPKMNYIKYYVDKLNIPMASALQLTTELAVEMARENSQKRIWEPCESSIKCRRCGLLHLQRHIDSDGHCLSCSDLTEKYMSELLNQRRRGR